MAGIGWNRRFNFFARFFSGRINRSYVEHRNDGIYPIRNLMSAITLLISTLMLISVSQETQAYTGYFSSYKCVSIFDTETDIVTQSICPASGEYMNPYLLMMPDGKKIYDYGQDALGKGKLFVINAITNKIEKNLPYSTTLNSPPILSPDGKYLYVSLISPPNNSSYSILDTSSDTVVGDLTLPFSTQYLTITKDGLHAFAVDYNSPTKIHIVDLINKTIISTFSITWQDVSVPGKTQYWEFTMNKSSLGLTPNGNKLFVAGSPQIIAGTTNYGRPDMTKMVVLDAASLTIASRIQFSSNLISSGYTYAIPATFTFTPDSQRGYLNYEYIWALDTINNAIVGGLSSGFSANTAKTPDGKYGYISDDFVVYKFDTATNKIINAVSNNGQFTNFSTYGIVIQPDIT